MAGPHRLIRTVTLPLAVPPSGPLPVLPDGILELRIQGSDKINLTYDLRLADLAVIEAWLDHSGYPLANGFWDRLRRRWLAFKDDNRRDQAAIVHKCCSVPPPKD